METLFLRKGCDRRLKGGHLWVFSNEVDTRKSPLTAFDPGQSVQVADAGGRILGSAYVNPASLITARLISRNPAEFLGPDLLRRRIREALALRERLFPRPFYRLCHGEGDFLPGLVIDRHQDHLVLQCGTAGMEGQILNLADVLCDLFRPHSLFLHNDLSGRDLEGLPRENRELIGPVPEYIEIEENGLVYTAALKQGQKTGWFYDQRFNRAALIPFASGAEVLDAFCYAGGFGALAARYKARGVTFLDSSAQALDLALRNARSAVKQTPEPKLFALHGEALPLLAALRREGRRFTLICLDPPAFIKRRKDAAAGLEAYRRVNELALDLLSPEGLLLTCSCSYHLEDTVLLDLVRKSAARRGRFLRQIFHGFQGPDHPVHPAMPETAYLKAYLFQAE